MKYARIVEDFVTDVATSNPFTLFHPDVAKTFEEVPDFVQPFWKIDREAKTWVAPEPKQEPVIQEPLTPEEVLAYEKVNTKSEITQKRVDIETGGITLPNGTRINTGIDDQNRISSAIQGMADAGIAEVDFKAESGWVKLTLEEMKGVAAMIAGHVQACFSKERALHGAVDAATTVEELKQIDVNVGWPGMEASRSEEPV